ncbi:MAG: hypothetical protein AAGG02_10095 [Cyanobacteria bacterium P01_H01_bin.15]
MAMRNRRVWGLFILGIAITIGIVTASLWGEPQELVQAQSVPMEQENQMRAFDTSQLDRILREEVPAVARQGNQWQLVYQNRPILVFADPESNRMRMLSPIEAEDLVADQIVKMMVANFHTALDARYAFARDGSVVSLYLHPLNSLQTQDLLSALAQVAELANTFGTTYSSSDMSFGTGERERANPVPSGGGVI